MATDGGRGNAKGTVAHGDPPSLIPHSRAFDAAFQKALDDMSQDPGAFAPGQYTVTVEFQAVVTVSNPGRVDSYIVNVS